MLQPKFKKKLVEEESYLTALISYIHVNPIKGKCCRRLEDWNYSSYNSLLSEKPSILKRGEVLDWYNGKEEFQKYHKEYLETLQ